MWTHDVYFAKTKIETINHLLTGCEVVNKCIWIPLFKWLSYMCGEKIEIIPKKIILNTYKGITNTCVLIVKHYVYVTKCVGTELNFMQM